MIVIIGTGLAGYQTAREFRKLDPLSPLMIITADEGQFYPKPQLSTAQTNKKSAQMLVTASAESMAKQLNATILTHKKVKSIDVTAKTVLAEDDLFPYDQLVLACGADVIKAELKGGAVADVLSINHLYHYVEFEDL